MRTFEAKARKIEREHRRAISVDVAERLVRELKKNKVARFGFGTFRLTKRNKNKLTDSEGEVTKSPHYYVSFKQSASFKRALQGNKKKKV